MATDFAPYWKPLGPPEGPNSWVFFAVARIAGSHRPVAVVSSVGDLEPVESLQGYPLTACCRRIITIFSDPENHAAVRAELALASTYYGAGRPPEPRVELPDFHRYQTPTPKRWRPWDHDRVHEFPFIATCLLQGVGFDAQSGRTCPTRLEPLGTVYRDSSIEWGMVIIDITDLDTVRYGIVGFPVCRAKYVPSLQAESSRRYYGAMGTGAFEMGELRLMDEVHLRQAMSASEYMTKYNHETPKYGEDSELLSRALIVGVDAMSLVWPEASEEMAASLPVTEFTASNIDLQSPHLMGLIQAISNIDDPKPILDEIYAIPNFRKALQRALTQLPGPLVGARAEGRLIRLTFSEHGHLSLERLDRISIDCIAAALAVRDSDQITSISICIDSAGNRLVEIIEVLSRVPSLRKIIFLQSPDRKSDDLSVRVFEELTIRLSMLVKIDVILTGAYSAALRKRFWLPTAGSDGVQLAPLQTFPVQQILIRHQCNPRRNPHRYDYEFVYLGDALLKPERFAAGFLVFLATLLPGGDDTFDSKAQLFSFSSCPGSLSADPRTSAQISPIPTENFALPIWFSDGDTLASPRVRDLVPEGWTVILSQLQHASGGNRNSYSIRYAFVRPRQRRIPVDLPTMEPLDPEDLDVFGLPEFLKVTAPNIDPDIIDRRLRETAEKIAAAPFTNRGVFPSDIEPLSVFTPAEAAESLSEFLSSARQSNKNLKEAMKEMPRDSNWYYPELLKNE